MGSTGFRVGLVTTSEQRGEWDQLAAKSAIGHMHQCLWWAGPLARYGVESRVLGCWAGGRLVGGALFRFIPLPFWGNTVAECFDGPIFLEWEPAWADVFVASVAELARAMNSMAVVFERCPRKDVHGDMVAALGHARLTTTLSPGDAEAVLWVEGRSLEELYKGFRKGTKYSIRKAHRSGVQVVNLTTREDLNEAYATWIATARRKKFSEVRPWPALEPVLRHSVERGLGSVVASVLDGRILAANFLIHIGRRAFAVYGGYIDGSEPYCPNHVLDYECIRQCVDAGVEAYNFGGLISYGEAKQSGVDDYKRGFGIVPWPHLETITWERRPRLYRGLQWIQRRHLGRNLAEWLKRRVIRGATDGPDGEVHRGQLREDRGASSVL